MRTAWVDDLEEINRWQIARGEPELSPEILPRIGFIEPGVACGFLYATDTTVCFLENFISAPSAGPKARNEAVEKITDALLKAAAKEGYRRVMVICRNTAIEKRATRRKFRNLGAYTLMTRMI